MKTEQEAFNQVWEGLKSQGWNLSTPDNGLSCAYRGSDGRKCAAGWLIEEGYYTPKFEGHSACSAWVSDALRRSGFDCIDLALRMQAIHDKSEGPLDMEQGFRRLAKEKGFTIPGEPK